MKRERSKRVIGLMIVISLIFNCFNITLLPLRAEILSIPTYEVMSSVTTPASINLAVEKIEKGELLTVNITGIDAFTSGDWIALVDEESNDIYQYYSYKYVKDMGEGKGTFTFDPSGAGGDWGYECKEGKSYKFHLFANGQYDRVATSKGFTYGNPVANVVQVSVAPDTIEFGETVQVTITGVEPIDGGHWIALVDADSSNVYQYYTYKYVEQIGEGKGKFDFSTAANKGDWGYACEGDRAYKFFLFENGGYQLIGTSNAFSVKGVPQVLDLQGKFELNSGRLTIKGKLTSGKDRTVAISVETPTGEQKTYTTTTLADGAFSLTIADTFTEQGSYKILASEEGTTKISEIQVVYDKYNVIPQVILVENIVQKNKGIDVKLQGIKDNVSNYTLGLYKVKDLENPLWEKPIKALQLVDHVFRFNPQLELAPEVYEKQYIGDDSYQFILRETDSMLEVKSSVYQIVEGVFVETKHKAYTKNEKVQIRIDNMLDMQPRDWMGIYKESEENKYKPIWFGYMSEMEMEDGYYIFDPNTAFLPGIFMDKADQYKENESYKIIVFSGDHYENPLYTSEPFKVYQESNLKAEANRQEDKLCVNGSISTGKDYLIYIEIVAPNGVMYEQCVVSGENGVFSWEIPLNHLTGVYRIKVYSPSCVKPIVLTYKYSLQEIIAHVSLKQRIVRNDEKIEMTYEGIQSLEEDYIALYEVGETDYSQPIWKRKISEVVQSETILFDPSTILYEDQGRYKEGDSYQFILFYGNTEFVQCKSESFEVSILSAQCYLNENNQEVTLRGSIKSEYYVPLEITLISPIQEQETYQAIVDKEGAYEISFEMPFETRGIYQVMFHYPGMEKAVTLTFRYDPKLTQQTWIDYKESCLMIKGEVTAGKDKKVSVAIQNTSGKEIYKEEQLTGLYGAFEFKVPINLSEKEIYHIVISLEGEIVKQYLIDYEPINTHFVSIDSKTMRMTIKGYTRLNDQSAITLKVVDEKDCIDKLAQVTPEINGYYEYTYKIGSGFGDYEIYIGGVSDEPIHISCNVKKPTRPSDTGEGNNLISDSSLLATLKELKGETKNRIVKNFKEYLPYTYFKELLTLEQLYRMTEKQLTDKQVKELQKDLSVLKVLGIDVGQMTRSIVLETDKQSGAFKDVTSAHWAYEAIHKASTLGWATGVEKEYFQPNKLVNGYDSLTFLDRVLVSNGITAMKLPRSTVEKYMVNKEHWAFYHMASMGTKLSEETLVTISQINNQSLSRELLAQILYEVTQGIGESINTGGAFNDIQDSPYQEAINYCIKVGLLKGVSDQMMAPEKGVTRAELMIVLMRFNELLQ